ncbi:glycoside hydrolase family 35 protein [Ramaria rubella]|nr:glycoside hydrolase family 35 protein [Ramaria rubella]
MKWFTSPLAFFSAIVSGVLALDGYTIPVGSPGYQHGNSSMAIQFDSHSLFIDGKRTFLWSGEFHPWRLPVPQQWSDILQKMKAAGFNGVSTYINWGVVEGKAGELDWNYYRSLETFYQIAKQVGMYVVARPGPYINAETTGGGFPGWLTNVAATARTNQTGFVDSWQNYVKAFAEITSKYQYPDGPVIGVQSENEFYVSQAMNPTATEAMVLLETALRKYITRIPLTANDVYPSGDFASGPGEVDLYGFDSYPGGFDCTNPSYLPELANYYVSAHESVSPWAPMYMPEFQGGALDSWQGTGYDKCEELLGNDFVNVFYKNNVASGSFAQNFYMLFGGTNWGNLAYPGVYTSYDYGAAIRESRILAPKYNELKLQGLFYHASPSLLSTSIVNSGTSSFTSNPGIFVTQLGNGDFATNYYVVRQVSNNFTTPISFSLKVNTTSGVLTVPQLGGQITLAGRESKILVSEYPFGGSSITYSTAEIMTQATIDNTDYIILYVSSGQSFEAVVVGPTFETPTLAGSQSIKVRAINGTAIVSGSPAGVSVVRFGTTTVIVTDKATASTFWNPKTSVSYDASPDTLSAIVAGPYLVRNASISSSTLALVGDTAGPTSLTVFAPIAVKSVTWNGKHVDMTQSSLGTGLQGTLDGHIAIPGLPNLKSAVWRSADSLPEIALGFDDSTWIIANKTTTARPAQPFNGKLVLYADEYGFHQGNFIYRGYFSGNATGVSLSVQGGSGFGFSAFLNGHFLGSGQGLAGADTVNATFTTNLTTTGKNLLVVVSDSNGHDEDWNSNDAFKNPRGIRGYALVGGTQDFDSWKLTGNLGGEDFPDKARGPLNEGGLFAERSGAILPGFDDSLWKQSTPFTGLSSAGIQVYRTSFELSIPSGIDASLALQFTATPSSNYRSVIYVNGWQFGRFASNLGPQTTFPIPEGILNHRGSNDLVITLWSLDPQGAKIADLELVSLGVFASGKEGVEPVTSPTFQQLRNNSHLS